MRGTPELPGAYSELCKVGAMEAIRLPDEVSFRMGALIEPLAVGYNAVKRAQLTNQDSVLIMGAGPIGLSVSLWCNYFKVPNLLVHDLIEKRALSALEFGATCPILLDNGPIDQQIFNLLGTSLKQSKNLFLI